MGESSTTYQSSYVPLSSSNQSSSEATYGRRFSDLAISITPSFRKTSVSSDYRGSNVSLNSGFRGSNVSLNSGFRGSNVSLNSGSQGSKPSWKSCIRGSDVSLNSGFQGSNVSLNSGFRGSNVSLNAGFRGSNVSLNSFRGSNIALNSTGQRRRSSPDIKRGWDFMGKDLQNQVSHGSSVSLNSGRGSNISLNTAGRSRRNSLTVPDPRQYDGNSTPAIHDGLHVLVKGLMRSQGQLYTQKETKSRIPILHGSHGNLLHPDIDMYGSRNSLSSDNNGSCESLNFNISKSSESPCADNRRSRYHQSNMHMKKGNQSNPNLFKYHIGRPRLDSDMTGSNNSLYDDIHEVHSPVNKRKVLTKQNSVSQNIADVLINQSEQKYLGSDKIKKKWRDCNNQRSQSGGKKPNISDVVDQYSNKEKGKYLLPYSTERAKSHSDIINEVRSEQLRSQKESLRGSKREEKKVKDLERQKIKYKIENTKTITDNDQIRKKVQAEMERKRRELSSGEDKNNKLKIVGNVVKACRISRLDKTKFEKDAINANSICTVRLGAKNIKKNGYEENVFNKKSMKNKLKNNVLTVEKQVEICQRLHEGKPRKESQSSADKCRSPNNEITNQSNPIISLKEEKSFIDDGNWSSNVPLISRVMHRDEINKNDSYCLAVGNIDPVDNKTSCLTSSLNNSNEKSSSQLIESFNSSRSNEEDTDNIYESLSLTNVPEVTCVSDNESVNSEGKDESSEAGSVESGIYSHDDDDECDKSTASSVDSTIVEKTNNELLTDNNHAEQDIDECVKELMEKEYEVDSFSNIPEMYNADELILLSDSDDIFDNHDDISFKDLVISQNDTNSRPMENMNNDYFSNCNNLDDLVSLPHPGMPGSIDIPDESIKDSEPITIASDLINIIDKSLNSEQMKESPASKLDSNNSSFSSGSSRDESEYSTSDTEKFQPSDCDNQENEAICRPHVIKCSKNMKLFLKKQPCMHAHSISGRYSPVTEECFHNNCVIESIPSEKNEDDLSTFKEPIRLSPSRKRKKHSRKSKDKGKGKLEKSNSKHLTKDLNLKEENPSFIRKMFTNMFCTTPVTVGGVLSGHDDGEPEPLPPPIPPHGLEPGRLPPSYESITKGSSRETVVSSATEAETTARTTAPTTPPAPEPMTPDEAQRLLSAKGGLLSDAEAHEVALLLSPGAQDTPPTSLYNSAPPPLPPHYADVGPPPVGPRHYGGPVEDEYDSREASHFDPTLASPLSPEDAPSTPDSEISGDVLHVARVKEVLQEDGIHYLEDGHFWVEVPGLPEHDEDDEFEPDLPFHAHTKLSFSKHPMQMFSTYSVSEYDRKNEDVDPVAASAEYELEKRVEKMDIFPVDIVKGDGGLGLSIIGMGVGADAGVEKLGIFVKTITPQGATEKDDRIQVNDQIIEVDGKSLVGVTQVFAASVLKNTSGRVHFLIGREKDPENSEVALLIKQSLQADHEREERRRALGGPEYDPRIGTGLFDPLSSPSEENSRSEEASVQHNYASYMDAGGSSPTSPDAMSPPPDVFDCQGDTDDTSPDNDSAQLRLKLKEGQYKNAMAEAEITKLKMKLVEVESHMLDQRENSAEIVDLRAKVHDAEERLHAKLAEASTYQDMLEQSQGQFIVLEKKYYKAKKIIKEYQGRERDFLHREEYHITQLEDKDSHYNALVKALKDRVISLEADLMEVQKVAGLPVGPSKDTTSAYQLLHQHQNQHQQPKVLVCEELDEAVPPHELLDVSATRAKGELGMRGGLAGRHLPSLKKATSISSTSSQEQSIDEGPSFEDELPEALKASAMEAPIHEGQEQQEDLGHIPATVIESPASPNQPPWMPMQPPPPYSQATQVIQATTPTGAPPPYHHPPPQQFATPILSPPHRTSDSPTTSLPSWQPHMGPGSEYFDPQRPEIPGYRHPPPVARVQPVNRAEISESLSMVQQQQQQQHHLTAGRTPLQQSLAEQLKQLLAERESEGISQTPVLGQSEQSVRISRDASPSKPLPNSLIEDVRQAVMQADVSSPSQLGRKPIISGPVHLSSAANVVPTGQMVAQATSPPQRQSANTSAVYSPGRDSTTSTSSPRLGRSMVHGNTSVSANPAGVVLLNQRPIDHQQQKMGSGVDVGSGGELSSGPGSLGSGDEGSGASLGSQSSLCYPQPTSERSKKSHMWQTAPVTDWTKEQVCQWLVVQGLEGCVGKFQSGGITGPRLLNLDARDLKNLNLTSEEKNKIKRKVKELRLIVEKERKQVEKEKKEREKLMKKAEKLAKEAERKRK